MKGNQNNGSKAAEARRDVLAFGVRGGMYGGEEIGQSDA